MRLRDSLLYLIIYGPGYGESVILRIPGNTWIVIDGCVVNGRGPAADLLKEHGASWSGVIITHPHLDHALGLDAVLESPGKGPIGCTAPAVRKPEAWISSLDAERHLRQGTMEHVLATIHDRWTSHADSRWEMRRGDFRTIGEANLIVLHPDEATINTSPADPNRLSSGLLATWKHVRLLLGADVVAEDWSCISDSFTDLGTHHGSKLPHHGSRGAMHACWCEGSPERLWIVTPFNRGRKLPRFDDGEGISWALENVDQVHLTGLPLRHDLQNKIPYETTRKALRDGQDPPQHVNSISAALRFCLQPSPTGAADACFVAAGFDENGVLADLQHGPGALVVTEGTEAA